MRGEGGGVSEPPLDLKLVSAIHNSLYVVGLSQFVVALPGVESGLSVKALHCGLKDPGFQSQLQQRFISLPDALSPTPKNE